MPRGCTPTLPGDAHADDHKRSPQASPRRLGPSTPAPSRTEPADASPLRHLRQPPPGVLEPGQPVEHLAGDPDVVGPEVGPVVED